MDFFFNLVNKYNIKYAYGNDNLPVKKLPILRPEGSRRAGRWLDGVEEDLRTLGIRGWRRRALDRNRWTEVLTAARAQNGL